MAIRARIIRIGNSRGLRLPKHLLELTALGDTVELEARQGEIVIRSAPRARAGWAEQFRAMAEHGDDRLLDDPTPTEWDETEWQW
jgi:antitoxin MazE